jgi:hypothetical protein
MEVESCSWVPSIRNDMSTRLSSITERVECFAIQVTVTYEGTGRTATHFARLYSDAKVFNFGQSLGSSFPFCSRG